jgi:transcription initiation factor IIE alpha subunit
MEKESLDRRILRMRMMQHLQKFFEEEASIITEEIGKETGISKKELLKFLFELYEEALQHLKKAYQIE